MVVKKLFVGDYGFALNFTLKDGDGNAIDLTNATSVTFKLIKENGTVLKTSGACTINTPKTLGTVFYTVLSTDLDEVGEFTYQIMITEAASIITCVPQETINVLRKF